MLAKSKTLSISIALGPEPVYRFVSNPENLPRWIKSFVQSVENRGGQWILHTSEGLMEITFVETNDFGVLDHIVTLPSGVETLNPMRVIPNGTGSTVLFTLFQSPGMTDAAFEKDQEMIRRDLDTLKQVLESDF